MKYIKEFNTFITEKIDRLKIASVDDLSIVDKFIEAAKKMNQSDPVLWRGMSTKDETKLYSSNSTFVEVFADRDKFRGDNQGAKKMMKMLNINDPIFVNFNPGDSEFFGQVYAVIPNKPWKIYQSELVDDVMEFNQEVLYYSNIDRPGSRGSIQIGRYKFKSPKHFEDIIAAIKKIGKWKESKLSAEQFEEEVYKLNNTQKDFKYSFGFDTNDQTLWMSPEPDGAIISEIQKYTGQDIDSLNIHPEDKIYVRRTGKHEDERAKRGAESYKTLRGTNPILPKREGILSANSYYAVDMKYILENGGRFMKYKRLSDIKTYKDLIDALYTYRGFRKWMFNKYS